MQIRKSSPHRVLSLVLRRMRAPLIMLITIYAISVLGMVLIPGQTGDGQPYRMDFFHAFYFVSYMATTIGFGEIPYEFTDSQRWWTLVTLYLTVIAWLYAIGKILALLQDPALKRAVTENRFSRSVQSIHEPFYLICGYGDTGRLVTKALCQRGLRVVTIDIKQERLNELLLTELEFYVPGLCADAGDPNILKVAGLASKHCIGVIALTDKDQTNLEVAITAKLLNPNLKVICRAETESTQNNMASFGTDHIINPFEAFAQQVAMALHSPELHTIFEWLTQMPRTPLAAFTRPPQGHWILCGYGRFGRSMEKHLKRQGIHTTVVEADPVSTGCKEQYVVGVGTEATTLLSAHVNEAVGIVAGTNDDANNLSILMTAMQLNPTLYTVARQNKRFNDINFQAINAHHVMQHSEVVTLRVLALVTSPLLHDFLRQLEKQGNERAKGLVERLEAISERQVPDIWTLTIDHPNALAVEQALKQSKTIQIGHLTSDPRNRDQQLSCMPLLLKRDDQFQLLPDLADHVEVGDQILFCRPYGTIDQMYWTLLNHNKLRYVISGETRPDGLVWRWLANR